MQRGPDRRQFLRGAAAGVLASCSGARPPVDGLALAHRPVRRSVATLAPGDPILVAYRSAVQQMKALPDSDRRSWAAQARLHLDHCPHGNWLFLPWHRAYLYFFERICRKLSGNPAFALPYWNWSRDHSVPAAFFGDGSNPLADPTRAATATSVASEATIGNAAVDAILDETNFLLFASSGMPLEASQRTSTGYGRLEATPHNYIHGFVGGHMGGFQSPLDPLFWTHHNMIDRLWVEWNYARHRRNTSDPAWLDRAFTEFCDEDGRPVRVTVTDTLLYPALAYRYDDVGVGVPRAPGPPPAPPPDTRSQQDDDARVARAGATVRLDVVRRFAAPRPIAATLDRPASVRLAVAARALETTRGAPAPRKLLAFTGASLDHTEDFSVRVFVNKPDATVDTPVTDPHFAGAFAFFSHADHGGQTGSFVIDAGAALQRLGVTGGDVEVTTVLVPFPGRAPRTRELTVATTELRTVSDVVEPTR